MVDRRFDRKRGDRAWRGTRLYRWAPDGLPQRRIGGARQVNGSAGGEKGAGLTRGEAIHWLATRTAGLGLAGGTALLVAESWPAHAAAAAVAHATHARRAATVTASKGVQAFRSRPDLHPPVVQVDVPAAANAAPGLIVTESHLGPGQEGPLLFDAKGDLVWFLPLSPRGSLGLIATNVMVQIYKGEPVLTWFQGALVDGHGEGHYVMYDTRYREVAQVHAAGGYQGDLHEFVLTDRNTALFTCYGTATADLRPYGGTAHGAYNYGVVQEVDLATGKLVFQWRSDDHVGLDESYLRVGQTAGGKAAPWDYFHVNAASVDPTDGNLIVSARNTWTVYKVNRTTGVVMWRLNGKQSDFPITKEIRFAFQHDARRWPGGLMTIFDDEAGPPAEASQSRGLALSLDETSRTVRLVAQYHRSPGLLADSQGSVQVMPEGHRFICWGAANGFTEFDGHGKIVFDARMAPETESYRAFKQAWNALPVAPPDMAAVLHGTGVTIYASWNGATDVAHWSVLGGSSASDLRTVASAARSGFETAIAVPARPAFVAVEALDARGRVLGRSAAQTLTAAVARGA